MARALSLLPSSSTTSPIVVRLSGLAQTNDRLAIKEMGRQIAEAEGKSFGDIHGDDEDAEHAEDAVSVVAGLIYHGKLTSGRSTHPLLFHHICWRCSLHHRHDLSLSSWRNLICLRSMLDKPCFTACVSQNSQSSNNCAD
jgi:hypothetical protein